MNLFLKIWHHERFHFRKFDIKNDFMTLNVNYIALGIQFEILLHENNKQQKSIT